MSKGSEQRDVEALAEEMGWHINPPLHEPLFEDYRGNPAIERLPPYRTAKDVIRLLRHRPVFDPAHRALPGKERVHLVVHAMQELFVPLPIHLDLEQRLSCMLYSGYSLRNPVDRHFYREIDQKVELFAERPIHHKPRRQLATGMVFLGDPGVGKTTSLDLILGTYPQVIVHTEYRGRPCSFVQIVWMKLDCPQDGSIKGLCIEFFGEIDRLLSTNYHENYARRGRATVDEMMPLMARVASLHGLGVLVIDEIQHLHGAKTGGSERMLNFFVRLVNTIGLPVVLVGTRDAMANLSREFRQARRAAGQGDMVWQRMSADDPGWDLLVQAMWEYQYVSHPIPHQDDQIKRALHVESQGIVDFAVKLFRLAQREAINTGVERLTVTLIEQVAKTHFNLAREALDAMKSGDLQRQGQWNDIVPIGHTPQDKKPAPQAATASTTTGRTAAGTPAPQRNKGKTVAEGLHAVVAAGLKEGIAPHEALDAAAYLRPAVEFLQGFPA